MEGTHCQVLPLNERADDAEAYAVAVFELAAAAVGEGRRKLPSRHYWQCRKCCWFRRPFVGTSGNTQSAGSSTVEMSTGAENWL
jgi:hypothetical protein